MDDWEVLKAIVFERDGNECVRCDNTTLLSAHHIKPRAEGGADAIANLVTLCKVCHDIVELDPIELFIKAKSYKAQEMYYNMNRGSFSPLQIKTSIKIESLTAEEKAKIRKIKAQQKSSTYKNYFKTHPLTDKEHILRKTDKVFRVWLRNDIKIMSK